MSWNFLRYTQPLIREMLFPQTARLSRMPDQEFTAHAINTQTKCGRAWRVEELRLKSYDDLHKLWYVLLKEKLALKSDKFYAKKMRTQFYGRGNVNKVAMSMARLLTVVNERKKLTNQFRKLLEDKYIDECKQAETTAKAEGKPARKEKKRKELKDPLKGKTDELTKTSVLATEDVSLIKDAQVGRTQRQLLKKYVRNWRLLNPKQRRIALAKINAVRAGQAKEIIMKELYTISEQRKMGKSVSAEEVEVKKRLESII